MIKTDKELKKDFKIKASLAPDKYYATETLKAEGFIRKQCTCKTFFLHNKFLIYIRVL